jgi:hypothetical protein
VKAIKEVLKAGTVERLFRVYPCTWKEWFRVDEDCRAELVGVAQQKLQQEQQEQPQQQQQQQQQ